MHVSVRRYRPADEPAVKRLHEVVMRDAGGYVDADDPDLDAIEETYLVDGEFLVGELRAERRSSGRRTGGVRETDVLDGGIVAMGAFRPLDGGIEPLFDDLPDATAELKRMRVAPDHQRRGVGQRIYDELETRARQAGFRELVLDTTPTQTAAQRFYEANGFVHERDVDVTFAGEDLTLRLYRKRLG